MKIVLNEAALLVALQVWVNRNIGFPNKTPPRIESISLEGDVVIIELDETPS